MIKWWKTLVEWYRRGVCNNCKHLTFGVATNAPICMRNADLFLKHKRPDKFSCHRWEEGGPKEAWEV